MKNSSLLKWTTNGKLSLSGTKGNSANANKNWIHSAETFQRGHIVYFVKFLGCTEVDQPKGIEVVKEGIRKLQFNQQIKKSEGSKPPKVELTVSVDGVAIQDPKSKKIMYQYPLHRISYCADDKGEKRFFSFIAKEADKDNHSCFVFVSDKLAEEITLTIGQAFDLAYKRFLETTGKDMESRKVISTLGEKVSNLEKENETYRERLDELSKLVPPNELAHFLRKQSISKITEVSKSTSEYQSTDNCDNPASAAPPIPPRSFESGSTSQNLLIPNLEMAEPDVGRKLEGLLLEDSESPKKNNVEQLILLSPPPKPSRDVPAKDLFGSNPFGSSSPPQDLFGMGEFTTQQELENAIGMLDDRINEMRGFAVNSNDFTLESLDPLKN